MIPLIPFTSSLPTSRREESRKDRFLGALEGLLSEKGQKNKANLAKKALLLRESKEWPAVTPFLKELAEKSEEQLLLLLSGGQSVWAKFLFETSDSVWFRKLKEHSPFKGKTVIAVSYGKGYASFRGDTDVFKGYENKLSSQTGDIVARRKWATYDNDEYIIIFESPESPTAGVWSLKCSKAEVFWIGCKIPGIKSPDTRHGKRW